MPQILDPSLIGEHPSAVRGPDVAQIASFASGTVVVSGHEISAPVLRRSRRTESLGNAVLIASPFLATVQECWVEAMPGAGAQLVPAIAAVLAGGNATPNVRQVFVTPGPAELLADLESSSVNVVPWMLGGIAAVVILAAALVRRKELALYRDLGYRPSEVFGICLIGLWVPVTLGAANGFAWGLAAGAGDDVARGQALGSVSVRGLLVVGRIVAMSVPLAAALAVGTVSLADRRA
jgi:hypothetical protein